MFDLFRSRTNFKIKPLLLKFISIFFILSIGANNFAWTDYESANVLFNKLPRVALLVKEQYVDPQRVDADAMLASILQTFESQIPQLVVHLPPSLEKALTRLKVDKNQINLNTTALESAPENKVETTQTLTIDLAGEKKEFSYEPQRSIWGMIFTLRDAFEFIVKEAEKQNLTEKSQTNGDPINWEKMEYNAINAMLSTLDPHSVILEPKYARDLKLTTHGEFGGIGIFISIRDGYLTVISPLEGTPASRAGVKAKDRIIKINDDSAINMDLNEAVNLLRGKPNTAVTITVSRPQVNKEFEFTLKRAVIKVDSVSYALLDGSIGYLRIKAFQGNTGNDVKNAILNMKKQSKGKLEGVIIDMQDNPGGLLREAKTISSFFLDGGEVVSTKGARPESKQVEYAAGGELDSSLKYIALVNGGSASASEIVAGALKYGGSDNGGRGLIIGENTFGKGSVQMLFELPDQKLEHEKVSVKKEEPVTDAALKLTIAQYFAPGERTIQTLGIEPDIALNEVQASSVDEISLIPNSSTKEADLDAHLSTDIKNKQKPLMYLNYLSPKKEDENPEHKYDKIDVATLKKQFAIRLASKIIKHAKGSSRQDLLAVYKNVSEKLQNQEEEKIIDALKKHGIDWSKGENKSLSKDSIKVSVLNNNPVKSGEKISISLKAKNTMKKPIFRLMAVTKSNTPLFNDKEIIFGKLNPNQEITRKMEFEIPKDVVSRKDLIEVEFNSGSVKKFKEINLPISIEGLKRPRLAHMVYVDDSASKNPDGQLQVGEDANLYVWVKNIGEGIAYEPTVLLKNESGSKVFLKTGRQKLKELGPNEERYAKLSFRVKEPCKKVEFEMQLFDAQMHDIWRDKIILPVKAAKNIEKMDKPIKILAGAPVMNSISSNAKKIAEIKKEFKSKSVGKYKDFILVKVDDNLSGFIKENLVKPLKAAEIPKIDKKSDYYEINYQQKPPKVKLSFENKKGYSNKKKGVINLTLFDTKNVREVLLYVNLKKVLYKDVRDKKKKLSIHHEINLKPGVNVITAFAKVDSVYGQRENLTVYYDETGKIIPESEQVKNKTVTSKK